MESNGDNFEIKRIHLFTILCVFLVIGIVGWILAVQFPPQKAKAVYAVFVVDTTSDGVANAADCEDGAPAGNDCSLRDAIAAANATTTATGVTINFSIPVSDEGYYCYNSSNVQVNIAADGSESCSGATRWWKIKPTSILPTITNSVGLTFDGYSQAGAAASASVIGSDAVLVVEIDGTDAGSSNNGNGFYSTASNVTWKGFVINNFFGCGISTTGSNSFVQGNYIGTDVTGMIDRGNGGKGVCVGAGGSSNMIGGSSAGLGNLLSGNTEGGIVLIGSSNTIIGNYVGLKISGSSALGNSGNGIRIELGSANNTIGGTTDSARNYIAGNTLSGIDIDVGDSNVVQGNFIGLNVAGTSAIGNNDGIRIGSSNNTIGGLSSGARNIISGNTGIGVSINGSSATGNVIVGNYIGLNPAGDTAISNSYGIGITNGAYSNTIGSTDSNGRNILSGNTVSGGAGVRITKGSNGNSIIGNYVGLNAAGTAAVGNKSVGIYVQGSSGTIIGGSDTTYRNVIAGTTNGDGIGLDYATSTVVAGNYIGTDASGTTELANSGSGIATNSDSVTIGGVSSGAGNYIRGNATYGLKLFGASNSSVQYNTIFRNSQDQLNIDANSTGNTLSNNTVGNESTSTNVSTSYSSSHTIFRAGGNNYNSCGEGADVCLFYFDSSIGAGTSGLIPVTGDDTAVSAADGTHSFHLWLGTLSDLPGEYFGVLFRSDQFASANAIATHVTNNWGSGTATSDYFESDALTVSGGTYTFKGLSNFTTPGVTIADGSTDPLSLSNSANGYYGYRVAGTANTFTNEICINIGNCFLFAPSVDASYTVTSSTMQTVSTYGVRTSGSAAVDVTIQDTPLSTTKISRGATGGTITQKFNTRAHVTDGSGAVVNGATVSLKKTDGTTVASLTSGSDGYTEYTNATVYSVAGTATNNNDFSFEGTHATAGTGATPFTLDTKNETVSLPLAVQSRQTGSGTCDYAFVSTTEHGANQMGAPSSGVSSNTYSGALPVVSTTSLQVEPRAFRPLPTSSNTQVQANTLLQVVKYPNKSTVYIINRGFKYPIVNYRLLREYGISLHTIKTIPKTIRYRTGSVVYSVISSDTAAREGKPVVFKYPTSAHVYVLDATGKKRYIANEKVFAQNGFSWDDVRVVSPSQRFPNGKRLTAVVPREELVGVFRPMQKRLVYRMSGDDVSRLQERLYFLGYLSFIRSGGLYDVATVDAVRAFQRSVRLPSIGNVGPKTLTALNKISFTP